MKRVYEEEGDEGKKEGSDRKKSGLFSPDKPSPTIRVSKAASPKTAASLVDPKPAIQEGSAIDMPALKLLARRLSEIWATRYHALESEQKKPEEPKKEEEKEKEIPRWWVCFLENCAFDRNANRLLTEDEFDHHYQKEHSRKGQRKQYFRLDVVHREIRTSGIKADMSQLNALVQRLAGTTTASRLPSGEECEFYTVCLVEKCGFDESIKRFDTLDKIKDHFRKFHSIERYYCVNLFIVHGGIATLRNAPEKSTSPEKPTAQPPEIERPAKKTKKEHPTFICRSCGCEYRIVKSCEKHKQMHSLKLPLMCGPCLRSQKTPETAKLPTSEQLGKGTEQIPASVTHKGSPNQSAVKRQPEPPFFKICTKESCGFSTTPMKFKTEEEYLKHFKRAHSLYWDITQWKKTKTTTNFKCGFCRAIFNTRRSLLNHLPCLHGRHFQTCRSCLGVFKTQEELQSHEDEMHPPRKYKCPNCLKIYSKSTSIEIHFRTRHSHENQPYCLLCFRSFPSTDELQQHTSDFHHGISTVRISLTKDQDKQ